MREEQRNRENTEERKCRAESEASTPPNCSVGTKQKTLVFIANSIAFFDTPCTSHWARRQDYMPGGLPRRTQVP